MVLKFDLSKGKERSVGLPLFGKVNVFIDWGDGKKEKVAKAGWITHKYPKATGKYTVTLSGSLTEFGDSSGDTVFLYPLASLIAVESFGSLGVQKWTYAFFWAYSLVSVPSTLPSGATDTSYMFYYASSLTSKIGGWDVSKVTNMKGMFQGTSKFNQDLSKWDVSSVVDMGFMFYGAPIFNQDISKWNVSKVTDMTAMFMAATAFNQNIGGWNVSKVQYMTFMFYRATAFNQNIKNWKSAVGGTNCVDFVEKGKTQLQCSNTPSWMAGCLKSKCV